jgi:hypothetical protein
MRRHPVVGLIALLASLAVALTVYAQSGHFQDRTVSCEDIGTQVQCSGKVAGLGGTTFTVSVTANGQASVVCTNPGDNPAPGQAFSFTATGNTGSQPTPRNGSAQFLVSTTAPTAPANSCPNPKWTATVTDVAFSGDATLTLTEDSTVSDTITVPVE